MSLAANYADLCRRIAIACGRAGRDPAGVQLVAVTKYAPIETVHELIALGHVALGENRPQQLLDRASLCGPDVAWHLIGSLQRNKARKVLPVVSLIHSIDSVRLLETLDRLAGELSLRPRVLLEVNVSGETSKHGFSPDELREAWPLISACQRIDVAGLMTMAPYSNDPESSRPVFRSLFRFRDELATRGPFPLPELSMGMSGDFEVAIKEGATIIRVGSALYRQ